MRTNEFVIPVDTPCDFCLLSVPWTHPLTNTHTPSLSSVPFFSFLSFFFFSWRDRLQALEEVAVPKAMAQAESVMRNVKAKGAAQGDIMDEATEAMLWPQVGR